jgi:DNA-binding transcriptional ArsR family regulator
VAFFSEVVQVFGVSKSVGQIYGLLYSSREPLSFSDIVERLEISKGSASQGLQLLRSLGAVKVAEAKQHAVSSKRESGSADAKLSTLSLALYAGGVEPSAANSHLHPHPHFHSHSQSATPHRVTYEPELSLRRLVGGLLRERLDPLLTKGKTRFECLRMAARIAESDAQREFQLGRLERLGTWQRQATLIMPVFKTLLAASRR